LNTNEGAILKNLTYDTLTSFTPAALLTEIVVARRPSDRAGERACRRKASAS
jgi:hypothetical protein